jgi:AcrR family transcriptional regulator
MSDDERATRAPSALRPQQIVDAAMALTRRDGLSGLTMRKLAAALGVTSMAPYAHFPSKEALVDAITEQVFAQIKVPIDDTTQAWNDRLRSFAWAVHDVLVEYPGIADQIYTYQRFPPSAVPLLDFGVQVLRDAGFDDDRAAEAFDVLASVVITRTHFEAHQRLVASAQPDTTVDDRIRAGWHQLVDRLEDEAPGARTYVDHLDRSEGPTVFGRALDVVLLGLEAQLRQI